MAKRKKQVNVESFTMSQVMKELKPAQLWSIIVLVFVLLSGAFGIGYKMKASEAQGQIAEANAEAAEAKAEVAEANAKIEKVNTQIAEVKAEVAEANVKIAEAKLGAAKLDVSEKQLALLKIKERFFALYLRYLMAKEAHAEYPSPKTEEEVRTTLWKFQEYILELDRRAEENPGDILAENIYLHKPPIGRLPDPNKPPKPEPQAKITLMRGEDPWPIPNEAKIASED